MTISHCIFDGMPYKKAREDQRFCSPKCRDAWNNRLKRDKKLLDAGKIPSLPVYPDADPAPGLVNSSDQVPASLLNVVERMWRMHNKLWPDRPFLVLATTCENNVYPDRWKFAEMLYESLGTWHAGNDWTTDETGTVDSQTPGSNPGSVYCMGSWLRIPGTPSEK